MNRCAVIAATLVAPVWALGAPLDDALRLVRNAHPVLQAERSEYQETTRQHSWSSDITVGWTERGTAEGGAAGPNAGISVTIPLFDRSHELRSSESHTALMIARDTVLTSFMARVAELDMATIELHEAERMRQFRRDRLEYQQRQVEEGISEPDTLWPVAEALEQADLLFSANQQRVAALREHIARQFGGAQWMTLRGLLVAHETPTLH